MQRTIFVNINFLAVSGIIILSIVFLSGQSSVAQSSAKSSTTMSVTSTSTAVLKWFTITQVAQHKNSSDCWTIVRGDVYDVTTWISKHPGGDKAIIRMCGVDATSAFVDQHNGQRRPESELTSFKIGMLQ